MNGWANEELKPIRSMQESLKNLTEEDFAQLAQAEERMQRYEERYQDTQGTGLENELARIIKRYAKEGKNEQYMSDGRNRQKVRFQEEAEEFRQQEESKEVEAEADNRI